MRTLIRRLTAILGLLAAPTLFAAFGLSTSADFYTVDTGGGLVFEVRRTDNGSNTQSPGDLASLVYNGVEYQNQSRGSQITSGFDYLYSGTSSVTVSATTIGSDFIKITVTAGDLTHYYMARKGYPHIYMATYFTTEPDIHNLVRYIVRIPRTKLPDGPTPSDIHDTDVTVESGDIFGFSDTHSDPGLRGQTRSKHYSNMRLKDWSYIGASGPGVGVWMLRSNHEGDSGGPFYRSLLMQTGSDQEITYIINYGQVQTEPYRTGILNGAYTLVFNDGSAPTAPDTSWVADMGLTGFVGPGDRGAVSASSISGRDADSEYTAGFSNSTAQYWAGASPADGSFTCSGMIPGTYTMKIYRNEHAVHETSISVSAGSTTALGGIAIDADPNTVLPLWRIGVWDGTPREFINGDKVTTMHPSDVRMEPWAPGTYVVGSSAPGTGFPAYQWKEINGSQVIQFNLTAGQATMGATLRVGVTCAYANGRPDFEINGWNDGSFTSPTTQPGTRSLTVGSYRGNNTMFSFSIPASALNAGTNTLTIFPISGSGLSGYLSAGYSNDAVDFYPGSPQTLPIPGEVAVLNASGGTAGIDLDWSAASDATAYRIQRAGTSGGPYATVAPDVTGTSYTDTTADEQTTYYYRVNAINTSGSGFPSPEASASWVDDTDGDLIPDSWETTYYPSPGTAGPLDDTDGDGFDTWAEWKAGTDPTVPTSKPGTVPGTTTLQAVADTFIAYRSDHLANSTNFGTSTDFDVSQQGDIFTSAYVRFDLSTLPALTVVNDATLTFTQAGINVLEPGYPLVSNRNDTMTTGRFASYGLLDVAGNTAQDWGETDLTHDTTGTELSGSQGLQFDESTGRVVSFDDINETVDDGVASVTGSGADALVAFLQSRLDSGGHPGLATFILDFLPDDGRGFAFDSRETVIGTAPALQINYTAGIPIPDRDEDDDGLDDGWEAEHFGTLGRGGDDDADGDGSLEWLEQAYGHDPNDSNESMRAKASEGSLGNFSVTWPNAEGLLFTVESATSPDGPWITEATISGSASPTMLDHPIDLGAAWRFYRVGASPQP